jgi:type IV pilus assembly protein PilV
MKRQLPNPRRTGFSIIEVLVTLTIVSFGLLGLAAMLVKGILHSDDSMLQSVAVQQAYDLADRMRANVSGVNAGNYDSVTCPAAQACTPSALCTPAQLATYDICTWNSQNGTLLSSGQGTLNKDGVIYAITVGWHDRSSSGGKSFTLRIDP